MPIYSPHNDYLLFLSNGGGRRMTQCALGFHTPASLFSSFICNIFSSIFFKKRYRRATKGEEGWRGTQC